MSASPTNASVKRAVKATMLGNAMEWFDFGVYAYLATTIGKVFFPDASGSAQLLLDVCNFCGCLHRPPSRRIVLRSTR